MSNRIYHEACGQPTEYTLSKPKFCSSCGKPFDTTAIASAPTKRVEASQAPAPKRPFYVDVDDDDDEDFDSAEFRAPRKLEVEIDSFDGPKINRIPMSSLASQGPVDSWGARETPKKMTKKAVKAKYQEIFNKLNSRSRMSNTTDGEE
jgi:hypothetical protein